MGAERDPHGIDWVVGRYGVRLDRPGFACGGVIPKLKPLMGAFACFDLALNGQIFVSLRTLRDRYTGWDTPVSCSI